MFPLLSVSKIVVRGIIYLPKKSSHCKLLQSPELSKLTQGCSHPHEAVSEPLHPSSLSALPKLFVPSGAHLDSTPSPSRLSVSQFSLFQKSPINGIYNAESLVSGFFH